MKRPYTICYLCVSAEGHIDGEYGRLPEAAPGQAFFRRHWLDFHADAIIYGAVTMAMFAAGRVGELPRATAAWPREDYIAPCDGNRYYVAVSPDGGIAYDSPYIPDIHGRGVHGIIHVLTENVGDDYLEYLRSKQISYIFCGKQALDPVLMMAKLYERFGIRKAILSGGAYADWTMLSAGLIDEMQFMFLPVVDGSPSSHSLFRRMEQMEARPVALELIRAEVVEGSALLVTYRPKNTRESEGAEG